MLDEIQFRAKHSSSISQKLWFFH